MNKKKIIAVLVIVLCLSILGSATAAYFTAKDTAHNVITTGTVDIEVVEKQNQDGILVDYPQAPITGVMPGQELSKIVSVTNTGTGDAWVRIRLGREILSAEGEQLPLVIEPELEAFKLNINTEAWTQIGDWFYCKTPLTPGMNSAVLFDTVTFAPEMGNEYQGCTTNILVDAQAVQVKNNPLPANGDFSQIPGWPAEAAK